MPGKMEWATVYQSSAFVMCHLFAQHFAALGSTAYLETEEDTYAETNGDPTSLNRSDALKAVNVIEALLEKHLCLMRENPW